MTLEDFVTGQRIPSATEFVALAEICGYTPRIRDDGIPVLRGDASNPLGPKLAKMLSREPYRTNVLEVLKSRRMAGPLAEADRPENTVKIQPAPPPPVPPAAQPAAELSRDELLGKLALAEEATRKGFFAYDSANGRVKHFRNAGEIPAAFDRACVSGEKQWTYLPKGGQQ